MRPLRVLLGFLGLSSLFLSSTMAFARRDEPQSSSWVVHVTDNPDGTVNIYRTVPNGGSSQKLLENVGQVHRISFAPDGKTLIFDGTYSPDPEANRYMGYGNQLYRLQLADADVKQLTYDETYFYPPSVEIAGSPTIIPPTGQRRPIIGNPPTTYPPGVVPPLQTEITRPDSVLPEGEIPNIFLPDAHAPAISPDGQWIAFVGDSRQIDEYYYYTDYNSQNYVPGFGPLTDTWKVYIMRTDGTEITELADSHRYGRVYWSPDSQWIAYVSTETGNAEIYKMTVDGNRHQQLTYSLAMDLSPSWSPDGNYIAFLSDRDNQPGIYNVYVVSADGTELWRVTDDTRFHGAPAWSPDGEWIAFVVQEPNQIHHIYRARPDGSDLQQVTIRTGSNSSWAPTWSPPFELKWGVAPNFLAGGVLMVTSFSLRRRRLP